MYFQHIQYSQHMDTEIQYTKIETNKKLLVAVKFRFNIHQAHTRYS